MNPLTDIRNELANTMSEAGIRAFGYAETKLVPPCAAIVPDEAYVSLREGDLFGNYNVAVRILLLGPKATEKVGSEVMDDLILKALRALNDDFDVMGVSAPAVTQVNGVDTYAAIIEVEVQINLMKGSND